MHRVEHTNWCFTRWVSYLSHCSDEIPGKGKGFFFGGGAPGDEGVASEVVKSHCLHGQETERLNIGAQIIFCSPPQRPGAAHIYGKPLYLS